MPSGWLSLKLRALVAAMLFSCGGVVITLGSSRCADSPRPNEPTPTIEPASSASFEMFGTILGPVDQDDDADMRVVLRETGGGEATLNFVRVICTNRVQREWGAGSLVNEFGSNRIVARMSLEFVRHYHCPDSSRSAELVAELSASDGSRLIVRATPVHPDWAR